MDSSDGKRMKGVMRASVETPPSHSSPDERECRGWGDDFRISSFLLFFLRWSHLNNTCLPFSRSLETAKFQLCSTWADGLRLSVWNPAAFLGTPHQWPTGTCRVRPSPQGCGGICGGDDSRNCQFFTPSILKSRLFLPYVSSSRCLLYLSEASCALSTKSPPVTQNQKGKSELQQSEKCQPEHFSVFGY